MGRARRWAGEVTCDTVMTGELSAVACAAKESTNCQRCIPLVVLRQRRRLAVHLLLRALSSVGSTGPCVGCYILQNRENVTTKVPSKNSKALEQEVFRKWI